MTLILSHITKDFVVQVSDRRVTGLSTGEVHDDQSNKAIFCCGNMILGYTGVSTIKQDTTPEWAIASLLRSIRAELPEPPRLPLLLEHLKDDATLAFRRWSSRWKHHAFVAAGWMDDVPFMAIVSNALDEDMKWSRYANDRFKLRIRYLQQDETGYTHAIGQPLTEQAIRTVRRNFRKCLSRGLYSPYTTARILADGARLVAERNSRVGKDVMVSSIPYGALGQQQVVLGWPNTTVPTFLHVPAQRGASLSNGPQIVFWTPDGPSVFANFGWSRSRGDLP